MSHTPKRALIVDDEESIRYVLSGELKQLGYECMVATDGEEALKILETDQRFMLVMLDVRMPGISGLEVLHRFRPTHPDTCVVMLSALVDTEIAAMALKLGADDYITKPWGPGDIQTRLEEVFSNRVISNSEETGASGPQRIDKGSLDTEEVTKDLVSQQVTAYERITSGMDKPPKSRGLRRWLPWNKKS